MLSGIYNSVAEIVTRHTRIVVSVFLACIILSLIGASMITMETGSDTYMDKTTPRGMILDSYTRTFQADSLMILVQSDDVLTPDSIEYIDRLQREISNQRYVTTTMSVVDLLRTANGGVTPTTQAEILDARSKASATMMNSLVPSQLMTFIQVKLEAGLAQDTKDTVVSNFNSICSLSSPPPGTSVVVTGDPAFQKEMGAAIGQSMGQLILIAMILMILAVGVLFSHMRYRFLSVAIVFSGLIFTFGTIGFLHIPISMVTISAFPVLIGVGIDYAIQIHSRFDEETRHHPLPTAAMRTITRSGPSILFAMLATSMGFLAMRISPIPMIRDFGVVCVIGVFCCYIAAVIGVPAFGLLFNYTPRFGAHGKDENGNSHAMESYNFAIGNISTKIAKAAIPVLLICALIAVIGFEMDNEVPINTDENTFVPNDMPAKVNLDKVRRAMGSTSAIPFYVQGDNVISPDTLNWMESFQKYELESNLKLTGSTSIVDLIRLYNGGTIPDKPSEVEDVLDRIPQGVRDQYVSGRTAAVISFTTVNMPIKETMNNIDLMRRDLVEVQPPAGVKATATGMTEMFSNMLKEIAESRLTMSLLAFVMIFILLCIIYRNPVRAFTPLIPITMLVGWAGLIMYGLKIDYTPMTATLGSLAIGVASEYTIVMMERCIEERENGLSLLDAISHSTRQIGTAISVSGIATVCGFAALAFSNFNLISNFGIVTVITVGISIIGAIIVMPAAMILLGRWDKVKLNPHEE